MPSSKQTRKQRHQAQVKTQPGKAIRGAQSTQFVKGAGYRQTQFVGGKKYYTPMSPNPSASGAAGDVTNITVSSGTGGGTGDIKSDGSIEFLAPQTGVAPTSDLHLATKKYVDDEGVLAANSVTVDKLQQVATDTFLGRDTAGTGNVEVITLDDLETMLQMNTYLQSASTNSLTDMTTSNPSAGHYLRHNGTNYVNTTLQVGDISGLQASQIPALATSKITSGTFADARISESSVTQHSAAVKSSASLMSNFFLRHGDNSTTSVDEDEQIKIVTAQGSYGTGVINTSSNIHTITLNAPDTNTNQLTTFTLTADSGSNQTIAHGNTLDIEGGTGVSTVVGSTDKVTVSIGQSIGTSNSPTFTGLTLSSLSNQSSEATAVMINGSNVIGKRELGSAAFASTGDFKGATAVVSVATGGTGQDNVTAFKNVLDDETWTFANATTFSSTITSGGHLITGVSNYNGLEVKGSGGSRPQIQWSNVNNGDLGVIYATEGQALIIGTGNSNTTAITIDSSQVATFASTVRCGADVVAYYSSDPRLKKNKKKIENPLKILDKINGYTFDWKNYAKNVGTHLVGSDYGVMADEIEEVMPELVHDRENGYKGVKYEKIVPLLIECIKEQQVQINQLKKWKSDKKWI